MSERMLIVPDLHFPLTDMKAFHKMLDFAVEWEPDSVLMLGDVMDYAQPSRWSRGGKEEFFGSVVEESKRAQKELLEPLREAAPYAWIGCHEGNHDERVRVYLDKYAPAVADLPGADFAELLDFDRFSIERLPDFYAITHGWWSTHGHRGGIRLNRIAGNTALRGAMKTHRNLIMGHTHRMGQLSETVGVPGSELTFTGVECGHLMDTSKVTYMSGGLGNWQKGYATARVSKGDVNVSFWRL